MTAPPPVISEDKAIQLGHPSYVWGSGQERRLRLLLPWVDLSDKKVLDIGCGIGTYVRAFHRFSNEIYGIDVDVDRVKSAEGLNVLAAAAEHLPFEDGTFDIVFLNEVIEHVNDDTEALREAYRILKSGGVIIIYAPNRLYPFETHGFFLGKRYVFRLLPLVNYLPDFLRNKFVPHARAYLGRDISRLLRGLQMEVILKTYVYPGFDGIALRKPRLAGFFRKLFYFLEQTPFRVFGLSHLVILRKSTPPGA
jgi:ubiquinone/menaquinone biosynthesis C-methylase UbiE